ncbi:MAG: DMT family transporter [Actinomycetota bacterium]|nr:DMT family transporter [Actinomycetota bacterium]
MDRRSWTWLLVLGAIWGASYMFIEFGLRDMSPGVIAWLRVALAAAVLLPLAAIRGALAGVRSRIGWLFVVGSIQVAAPFVLIAQGQEEITSSLAGILVASAPLFTALLAVRLDQEERSRGLRLVGVMVGFGGVAVLLGLDLGGEGAALLGGLMVVLASLGYAVGGFIVKNRLTGIAPLGMSATVLLVSTLVLAPVAVVTAPDAVPGIGPLAAVTALGVVGTGAAFVIIFWLISTAGPARAWIVTYIAPAFAVVYGATLLDERIEPPTIAGLVLILGGCWLAAEGRLPGRSAATTTEPVVIEERT